MQFHPFFGASHFLIIRDDGYEMEEFGDEETENESDYWDNDQVNEQFNETECGGLSNYGITQQQPLPTRNYDWKSNLLIIENPKAGQWYFFCKTKILNLFEWV